MQDKDKNVSSIIDELLNEIETDVAAENEAKEAEAPKKEEPIPTPKQPEEVKEPELEPTRVFKTEEKTEFQDISSHKKPQTPAGFDEARKKRVAEFEMQKNVENKRHTEFSGNHDDYESVADSKAVSDDLTARFNYAKRVMTFSAVFFILALAVNLLPFVKDLLLSYSQNALLITNTVFVLILIIINYGTVFGGLFSFFRFKADIDSPLSLASLIVLSADITYFFSDTNYSTQYFAGACAALGGAFVLNNFAKLMLIKRIRTNFNLVANEKKKYAVTAISGQDTLDLTDNRSDKMVAFRKPTVNLLNFLNNSFSDDPVSRMYRVMTYIMLVAAAGIVGYGVYIDNIALNVNAILSALGAVMLLVCPFASLLSAGVPISANNRKLRQRRIILNGFNSVKKFSKCSAVALTAKELFPKGSVQLISFEMEKDADFEQILTYAAALLKKNDSTLNGILDNCFDGNIGPIPEVEDYEKVGNFGMAGMVNGTPVLVGSAGLMDRFGIKGYNTAITGKINRFRMYISVGGKLSAQLLLRYVPDKEIAKSLQLLVDYGKKIYISSDDVNVSERLITRSFELDESCIVMLTDKGIQELSKQEAFEESVDGSIGFFGRTSDFVDAIICCLRLRTCYAVTKAIHIIFVTLAVIIAFVCIFFKFSISPIFVLGFQTITALVSTLLPMVISRD
ncbi:MAG: hypothetical protein IJ462_01085 [Clostridia bacterium]|nr:hypothetical protein [Clostridia bacterium]